MKLIEIGTGKYALQLSLNEVDEMLKDLKLNFEIDISKPVIEEIRMKYLLIKIVEELVKTGMIKEDNTPCIIEFKLDKIYRFSLSKIVESGEDINGWVFDYIID